MLKKAALFVISALISASVAVGGCLQDAGLLRSSLNCTGMPTIPKYFDPQTLVWSPGVVQPGKNILAVSDGNEILIWNITNSANPIFLSQSNFNIPNQGDSDYDLLNFSVGGRYGIAAYKLGIVIWDFGTGLNPVFGARQFYPSTDPRGGFSYTEDGNHFVIAKNLPGGTGSVGSLYRVLGVNNLVKIRDLNEVPYRVTGGIRVGNYIYLGTIDNWVYIYSIKPATIEYVKRSPIRASLARGKGLSVWDNTIAVSAFLDGGKVWSVANIENPALLKTIAGNYQYAATANGFMFIVGGNNIPKTYRLTNPSNPTPLDWEFWNPDNPWNDYGTTCEFPTGAAFAPDGSRLFLGRYAVLQAVNFSPCFTAPTPTPTPPPWPTPRPTCVPGCVSTGN